MLTISAIRWRKKEDMKKYEVVHIQPWNGKEVVIHKNLTEKQAIEYMQGIDNTYYREMERIGQS